MQLRDWSIQQTADRFVLHKNTVWQWVREFNGNKNVGLFFGSAPFNKLHDAVYWLVHEIRALCPQKEFGTRTIAMKIVQAGIKISRSSVQRILRKSKPKRPPVGAPFQARSVQPYHLLRPKAPNRVWHLDLTTWRILWLRFHIAAILDGFSRKLLALKVYMKAPTSAQMMRLLRTTVKANGSPRFLITDHGCQFRRRFREALKRQFAVILVKGRVRSACFNGKVERFFRTLKLWQRLTLFALKTEKTQRKLDVYRDWYNSTRPQWTLEGRTPDQIYYGQILPKPQPIRARDRCPKLKVLKANFRGDPQLLTIEISTDESPRGDPLQEAA